MNPKIKRSINEAWRFSEKILKKQKKADMSSKMIVTVIILIVGFILTLVLYGVIDLRGQSDKEICHNSVVLRGALPETFGVQEIVPLKCKTEKVCIRGSKLFGKGQCKEFENVKGVTYIDVNNLEEVEMAISDQIVDCWSMMGEGELSLFSQPWETSFGFGSIYSSCSICSRIAFDQKTLAEKGIDLSKRDVLNYMRTHRPSGKEKTYYEILTKGQAGVSDSSKKIDSIEVTDPSTGQNVSINISDLETKQSEATEEIAVLFMQISAPSRGEVIRNTLGALGLGTVALRNVPGVKSISSTARICFRSPYCAIASLIAIIGAATYQQVNLQSNLDIAATSCGDISVGDKINYGCSVVRTINYNSSEIQNWCSIIESIP